MTSTRSATKSASALEPIEPLIHEIRGEKVILDADLARIYGVQTKALNQAVKRNKKRFPDDFVFRLSAKEVEGLMSQIATSRNRSQFVTGSQKHRDPRLQPYAFTEHGAIMAANVLNSARAVEMSVYVVRAFFKMRSVLAEHKDLARELAEVEAKLTERLDTHELAIIDVLRRIMLLLDPPPPPPVPPKRRIGFRRGKP